MTRTVNMSPDTHFLESIRAQKVSYKELIGEAVDNSLDASASRIAITVNEAEIIISDDGIGVTRDRWDALVRLGQHMPTQGKQLGRYGIGIKYQAIAAGDLFTVTSRSAEDGQMFLMVDWAQMLRNGTWDINEPTWSANRSGAVGTKIHIGRLRRKPHKGELDRARDDIAQIFYPALMADRSIFLNGKKVDPFIDPIVKNPIEVTIEVSPGKSAILKAGELVDLRSKVRGIQVSYKHRVIMPNNGFGCFGYSTAGVFGRLELVGDWGLARFKDSIVDPDESQLQELVHEHLLPILENSQRLSIATNIDMMRQSLNAALPAEIAFVRPEKKQELGRKGEKKGKTGMAPDAPQSSTGPARGPRDGKQKVMIDFAPAFEEYGCGYFVPGKPGRIYLAEDNPYIKSLLKQRDRQSAEAQLFIQAMSIFENSNPQLDFLDGPYGMRLWRLLERHSDVFSGEEAA